MNRMDISKALATLQMNTYNFTTSELKKAYLKQALLCHPDKTGNTPNNTHKFQDVKESYDFLMLYAENTKKEEDDCFDKETGNMKQTPINVINFNTEVFKMFINNVLGGNYMNIVIDILSGITDLTILLQENISIETINKIKHFVKNYGDGRGNGNGNVNMSVPNDNLDSNLNRGSCDGIVQKQLNYTLNPTIDDLLDDNIYKLSINNVIYYVPLWHHECVYEDTDGNEIIVNCIPVLDNNIYIDDKNHIYTSISISLNNALLNETYYITIGKKKYKLPIYNLYIKSGQQQICLYSCGILEMNEDNNDDNTNFYKNNSIRSNIYITITLI